ncbi:hypothetical protein SAY87_013565 [Trapa incisa]|uniref:Uncharacterized protein n=1 Tax=Trapa incisa TaxID=236973 RepID=A0AAN7KDL7_9MYRT|nr:hypothetical protein SAY87_013565 [Trapa incisa]
MGLSTASSKHVLWFLCLNSFILPIGSLFPSILSHAGEDSGRKGKIGETLDEGLPVLLRRERSSGCRLLQFQFIFIFIPILHHLLLQARPKLRDMRLQVQAQLLPVLPDRCHLDEEPYGRRPPPPSPA